MNLTSGIFIGFLAVLFAVYYITPRQFRWVALLIGSLSFYFYSGFIFYLLATIVSTYIFSRLLEQRRSRVLVIVWFTLHIGLLAAVKVPSFMEFIPIVTLMPGSGVTLGIIMPSGILIPSFDITLSTLMPLGISFYTFQSAGYILDVYRKKAPAERNPAKLALFVSFFPQLIQGPISRFNDLTKTLYAPNEFSIDNISAGLRRMLIGFFKKLVIADRMLAAVALMSAETGIYYGGYAALNILLYAVVLYADFTGGIDIAIGAARLFGVTVTENFNKPFYSRNIAEYWRRWHITMGSWFREYVFYPLSASGPMRKFSRFSRDRLGSGFGKRLPVYITTIVTWFLTGLWHGVTPNFIAWGLANGIVIILSQECEPLYARFHGRFGNIGSAKWYNAFTVVRTFMLMCAIRSFDIYGGVGVTFRMVLGIFGSWNLSPQSIGVDAADCIVAGLGVLLLIVAGLERPREWFEQLGPAPKLFLCLLLLCSILVLGIYGYGYDATQFIYNQF